MAGTRAHAPAFALVLLTLFHQGCARADAVRTGTVHTIFSTECSPYFDWQSLGVAHTHKRVGQPGRITRLAACADAKRDLERDEDVMPTHYHPSWETHPTNGDRYSAYNMPASVIHWFEHAQVDEEYILYMDGDMTFRRPVDPVKLGVRRGVAVGAKYEYLYGLSNGMSSNFGVPNPELAPHVGGIYILHADDFRALAPRWLHWTERFRTEPYRYWADPDNANASKIDLATGDVYVKRGAAPWIAAMYGYAFAAAELGLVHKAPHDLMLYAGSHWLPANTPVPPLPMIIHYGLPLVEQAHAFDKQWYRTLDILKGTCPPRYFLASGLSVGAVLANTSTTLSSKFGALVTIETLCTLNEALASFYLRRCGVGLAEGSAELAALLPPECPLRAAEAALSALEICRDASTDCAAHNATSCAADSEALRSACPRTCGACAAADGHNATARDAGQREAAEIEAAIFRAQSIAALPATDLTPAECTLAAARGACADADVARRCAFSCNGASDADGRRRDRYSACLGWARTAQCWHNPSLMARDCPAICRFDEPETAAAARTCDAADGPECLAGASTAEGASAAPCVDIHDSCRDWTVKGECVHNEAYMRAHCCKSCDDIARWSR